MKDVILMGDAVSCLQTLEDKSINMCITSPPYWALRRYGDSNDEIGREATPEEYIDHLCEVFAEVYRVVRDDGTIWVNIADTYAGTGSKGSRKDPKHKDRNGQSVSLNQKVKSVKRKSMVCIPERFCLMMLELGYVKRNTIIWHKPNAIPQSSKDKFTNDFEYLYMFSKKPKYYFKQQFEPFCEGSDVHYRRQLRRGKDYNVKDHYKKNTPYKQDLVRVNSQGSPNRMWEDTESLERQLKNGRNKRCVWDINTKPTKSKHVAPYPEELVESPIDAGCPEGGVVLDPFMGSGTTAVVATKQGKHYIGIDLDELAIQEANERIQLNVQ